MKKKLSQKLILGAIVFAIVASVGNSAYSEDARVLPAGRSRLSFIYAQTDGISEQFNDQGTRESIAAPYNLQLNAANVKSVSPDLAKLVNGLNATGLRYNAANRNSPYGGIVLNSNDSSLPLLGDALSRGFLGTDAEARETQYNISYQYGVTDRLSIGFMIPIVKAQVTLDASLSGQNTASDIQRGLNSLSGSALAAPVADIANIQVPTIQQLLQQQGYTVPNQTNQSGIGDIVFGGRYNYYRTHYQDVLASVQAGVVAPTGALRDPTTPTQIDIGSGAWDLGVAHITNYSPWRFLTLSNGIHFDHRLAAHRNLIVESYSGQEIPPASNEENLSMQLGDKYWTNIGASANITKAFSLLVQYEWFWKRPDTYQGSVQGRDYQYLSNDTRQYSETIQLGASLSTIPAFMKKEFPLPTDVALNVYIPRAGMNTIIAPYGTAELALYF